MIPINIIFEFLIKVPDKSVYPEGKLPTWMKVKKWFGIILGSAASLGCIYIIYVLAANKTAQQSLSWKYDFFFNLIADFITVPLVYLAFQMIMMKIAYVNANKMNRATGARGYIGKKLSNTTIADIMLRGGAGVGGSVLSKVSKKVKKKKLRSKGSKGNDELF